MKTTAILILACLSSIAYAAQPNQGDPKNIEVVPAAFDPAGTHLVAAHWIEGIGCPTSASVAISSTSPTGTYTDPACATGDDKDKKVEGLLLVKTGPTPNFAAAGADIKGVDGITLTEIGYDLRKPTNFSDARGSHCGAGAPRFNVVTQDDVTHFIGCSSPPPVQQQVGAGWLRLRWDPAAAFPPVTSGETVKSISIVFDEGQDTGPDFFGLAVLDNIDINGAIAGKGPTGAAK